LRQRLTLERDLAAAGRVEPAQQVQQRALARTGGTDDGNRFARAHVQVHALEHGDVDQAFVETFGEAARL
jgi:hypothetical protein